MTYVDPAAAVAYRDPLARMYDEISRHGARTEAEERAQHLASLGRVDPPDKQPPGVRALNAAERAELREW